MNQFKQSQRLQNERLKEQIAKRREEQEEECQALLEWKEKLRTDHERKRKKEKTRLSKSAEAKDARRMRLRSEGPLRSSEAKGLDFSGKSRNSRKAQSLIQPESKGWDEEEPEDAEYCLQDNESEERELEEETVKNDNENRQSDLQAFLTAFPHHKLTDAELATIFKADQLSEDEKSEETMIKHHINERDKRVNTAYDPPHQTNPFSLERSSDSKNCKHPPRQTEYQEDYPRRPFRQRTSNDHTMLPSTTETSQCLFPQCP